MSSAENGRLVYVNAADLSLHDELLAQVVRLRHGRAPDHPAEAIYRSVSPWIYGLGQEEGRGNCADAVLAALGMPDVPQRPTPRDETPT